MKAIPLTKNQFAIVDDSDFDRLNQFKWHAWWNKYTKSFYAARRLSKKEDEESPILYMHREVLGSPRGRIVDHKNHDTLDNRRENLRLCTRSQNMSNRKGSTSRSKSGIRGVCWYARKRKWLAYISVDGKRIHLGYFEDKLEAKAAYLTANRKYFGEFGGRV